MLSVIYGIIYFMICLLQPICLPLPETATILFGSKMLGANISFVLGLAGILMGISIMFTLCRRGSKLLLERLERGKGIERYKGFVKKNEVLITGVLFIIPVLPDEIICVGAAVVGISYKTFMRIAILSKAVSIAMIAYSEVIGSILGVSQYEIVAIELVILFTAALIMKLREGRYEAHKVME